MIDINKQDSIDDIGPEELQQAAKELLNAPPLTPERKAEFTEAARKILKNIEKESDSSE